MSTEDRPEKCPDCGTAYHNVERLPRDGCTETRRDWTPEQWDKALAQQ